MSLNEISSKLSKFNLFVKPSLDGKGILILTKPTNKTNVGYIDSTGQVIIHWNWVVNTKVGNTYKWEDMTTVAPSGPVYKYSNIEEFLNDIIYEPEIKRVIFKPSFIKIPDEVTQFVIQNSKLIDSLDKVSIKRELEEQPYKIQFIIKELFNKVNLDL